MLLQAQHNRLEQISLELPFQDERCPQVEGFVSWPIRLKRQKKGTVSEPSPSFHRHSRDPVQANSARYCAAARPFPRCRDLCPTSIRNKGGGMKEKKKERSREPEVNPPLLCAQLLPGWKPLAGQRPPPPLCNWIPAHLSAPLRRLRTPPFAPLRRDVSNCITSGGSNARLGRPRPRTSAAAKRRNLLSPR